MALARVKAELDPAALRSPEAHVKTQHALPSGTRTSTRPPFNVLESCSP